MEAVTAYAPRTLDDQHRREVIQGLVWASNPSLAKDGRYQLPLSLTACMRECELTPLSSVSVTVCLRRSTSLLTGSCTAFLCVPSLTTAGEASRLRRRMAAELLAKSPAARAVKNELLMV